MHQTTSKTEYFHNTERVIKSDEQYSHLDGDSTNFKLMEKNKIGFLLFRVLNLNQKG
jgi:hypothetical protein